MPVGATFAFDPRMTKVSHLIAALLMVPATTAFAADDERGGINLGLDVGPNFVVDDADNVSDESAGISFAGRLGYRIPVGILDLTPEAKVGFESPGTPDAFSLMGGARLALGTVVTPVVFGHAGGLVGDLEGFVWDAGAGLQLNLDYLSIGADVSYNQVVDQVFEVAGTTVNREWQWVRVAGTVAVTF